MASELLIGEVCRLAHCTPRTVRHYEAKGIIRSTGTTNGGHKLYEQEAVTAIQAATVMKRLGYSLTDIRDVMRLTRSTQTRDRRLAGRLRKVIEDGVSGLDLELDLLNSARSKMAALLEATSSCKTCNSADCSACGNLNSLRTLGLLRAQKDVGEL